MLPQLCCEFCDMRFECKKALHMHAAVLHAKRTAVRLHIDTTFCPICGLEFHTRVGVMNHIVDKSAICHANLLLRPALMTPDQCKPFDDECRLFRADNKKKLQPKSKALLPCVRRHGPFQLVIGQNGAPIVTTNGHPLSSDHAWNRSPFVMGLDESISIDGCPASLRAPCTPACLLCAQYK